MPKKKKEDIPEEIKEEEPVKKVVKKVVKQIGNTLHYSDGTTEDFTVVKKNKKPENQY